MPVPSRVQPVALAAAVALTVSATACGSDLAVAPPIDVPGSYTLRLVNNGVLPRTISSDGASRVEITGGTLEMDGDATWTSRTDFRIITPGGTQETAQDAGGRWHFARDSIHFNEQGTVLGVIRGDTLRLIRHDPGGNVHYLYTR